MATKKTEETDAPVKNDTTVSPKVEDVITASVTSDSDLTGPSKDELEKVNTVEKVQAESEFPAPKLVNNSNGSQSFEDSSIQKVTHPEIVQGAYKQNNLAPQDVYVDNIETNMVMREKRIIDERLKKADFKRVMDEMEKSNPTKFAGLKDDLQKQMDNAPE